MPRPVFARCAAVAALGIGFTLAANPHAVAQLQINVTEAGGPTIAIVDNGPLDANAAIGQIDVSTVTFNVLLVNFNFASLSASSDQSTGGPNDPATLTIGGNASKADRASGLETISITASDASYLFPVGNPKTMTTADTLLFTNTVAGESATFQSFFDPANALFGTTTASPLLAFIPPVGAGPFPVGNPGVNTALGAQATPYSLTNNTVLTFAATGTIQFNGVTTLSAPGTTAVPEPGTYGLLAGMLIPGAAFLRRRK